MLHGCFRRSARIIQCRNVDIDPLKSGLVTFFMLICELSTCFNFFLRMGNNSCCIGNNSNLKPTMIQILFYWKKRNFKTQARKTDELKSYRKNLVTCNGNHCCIVASINWTVPATWHQCICPPWTPGCRWPFRSPTSSRSQSSCWSTTSRSL